ncbi:hypothetical protein [Lacipirellula parvula]|uniref:EF-hand domain-containing protein n=1 Tax=Lacipirellula parvula TaxID=2650471 RepID=A0A5K7XB12_9BACT|nr:hypothetical protein [Lacipirellula parvula]BBO33708.1 hypothetical protein PLANPX_3320 [Lacipirellula parvula]
MSVLEKIRSGKWLGLFALCVGCHSGPAKISFPTVDASAAAAGAMQAADKNGDAGISKEEAVAVPSLVAEFGKYDANGDGKIDAAEIESRIATWSARGPKVVPINFDVTLDGRALEGAEVVLEPEAFMGDVLPKGVSQVGASGACGPTVPKEMLSKDIPFGMFCGLYRVKITHPSKKVPAKYNEQTELGIEVAPDYDFFNRKTIALHSK